MGRPSIEPEDPGQSYVVASKGDPESEHTQKRKSDACNPLSRLFFYWVDPLIRRGYHTRLEPQDMLTNNNVRTDQLHARFDAEWKKQLALPKPDIKRAVLAGNWFAFAFTAVLYAIAQACTLAGPLLLSRILNGLQCVAGESRGVVCEDRSTLY